MPQVNAITFYGNENNSRSKTENVATGVGVTGATAAYASRKAASNGVWSTVGKSASAASRLTQKTADTLTLASSSASKFKKLLASFRLKKAAYIEDFTKFANKVKNMKVVGAILNNPVAKKAGAAFGGVMAFFVLVPSLLNMVKVVEDISNRA